MKPHQLRFEAFGPFATAVEIDFDTLSQEGLFLIHGRTGAGKTFLLDALCFALYGEVSGDRNLKGLKSDHAAPAAVPRVTLTFSCGGRRYRVSRTPAHTALRSRACRGIVPDRALREERLGLAAGAVVDVHGMAGREQVAGHAAAHDSGADETDLAIL